MPEQRNPKKSQQLRPDTPQGGRFARWWAGFVAEWKPIWHGIREFAEEGLELLEGIGDFILKGVELAQGLGGFVAEHGGRWLVLPAAVGAASPLSGGYGIERIAGTELGTWAPVVVLPIVALLLRAMLTTVAKESGRSSRRREAERHDPTIARELEEEAELRRMASQDAAPAGEKEMTLARCEQVSDIIAETHRKVAGGDPESFTLVLLSLADGRLTTMIDRGPMDDELKRAIECSWEDVIERSWGGAVDLKGLFEAALEPLQYRSVPFAINAGEHHCVLLGLSGATIPGEVALEVSQAATELLFWLVYGDEAPGSIAGEA